MSIDPATLTLADWETRRAAPAPSVGLVSDGRAVPSASGATFEDHTGRDGSRVARVVSGAIANDSPHGLAASVRTRDVSRAHGWARKLRAGVVWVNSFDTADHTVPFGGVKQSGFGRDRSLHALDGYTSLKTTWIDLA